MWLDISVSQSWGAFVHGLYAMADLSERKQHCILSVNTVKVLCWGIKSSYLYGRHGR